MIWLVFALIGALAGFLAGYLGIGGGLVLVPALAWLFARDPAIADIAVHAAVATSLASMLVTSLSSILAHQRRQAIAWNVVMGLTPGLLLGAVTGAWLATRLSTPHLAAIFGVYAALAGFQLLRGTSIDGEKAMPGRLVLAATGAVIGGLSSLVGIGGGSMTVPWLLWHGRDMRRAIATAAACGYPIALAGSAAFVLLGRQSAGLDAAGYVQLPALLGVAVASALAAPLGARAVHASPPLLVQRVFGMFMLWVAWRMLTQA